jgi:flagellar biosynthesis protein FlhG
VTDVRKVLSDQADGLRRLMACSPGRLVAVVGSGPAVGATSVTLNLAAALVQQGKEVLLLDERSGSQSSPAQREGRLVLIDAMLDQSGALSPLAAQADHVLVVLQPDAASITAAYACIKRLHYAHALQRLRVLVNRATDTGGAQRVLANLAHTGSRYLAVTLESAGCVRADPHLAQARRLNLTVVEAFQTSPAATDFRQMAADLLQWPWRPTGQRAPAPRAAATAGHEANPVLEMH